MENQDIKEGDFVILKSAWGVDYNDLAMSVIEVIKNGDDQITHVKCAWNDHLKEDGYVTMQTIKIEKFPISTIALRKDQPRKYLNTL